MGCQKRIWLLTTIIVPKGLKKTFHSLSPGFQIAAPSREFIPGGENIVMNCVSGDASKNLLIQQKKTVLSVEYIMPGSFYGCSCDDEWYFGVANYVSVENCDVNIKFFHPNSPASQLFRPSLEGTCWIPIHDIITKLDTPSSGITSQFYYFDWDEMKHVLQNLM